MYVCMHVCMYARMNVCIYVCIYVCVYVCMYISIYISRQTYRQTNKRTDGHIDRQTKWFKAFTIFLDKKDHLCFYLNSCLCDDSGKRGGRCHVICADFTHATRLHATEDIYLQSYSLPVRIHLHTELFITHKLFSNMMSVSRPTCVMMSEYYRSNLIKMQTLIITILTSYETVCLKTVLLVLFCVYLLNQSCNQ